MMAIVRVRKAIWGLAVLLVALIAVPGLDAGPAPAGVLTVGVPGEPVGLDPHIVTVFSSLRRSDLLYNRLVRYNDRMELVGDLAASWEIPDSRTYIFRLHRGVRFHNGRELVADDVKYSFERIADPATASPARAWLPPFEYVRVIDRYTVEFKLKHQLASFLSNLTLSNMAIVPREEVEKHGNLHRVAVGTGPFMLDRWVPDDHMRLVRNPHYFRRGLPRVAELVIRVIPDEASLLAGLRAGSLDMAHLSDPAVIDLARRTSELTVMQVPSILLRTFGFNTSRPPFTDVRVRQAIGWALDRQRIVELAERGHAAVSGPIPISIREWSLPVASLPYARSDVERAKRLLAEAGYPRGLTIKIQTSPGFRLLPVAEVIKDQLREAGIVAELEVSEWGVWVGRWVRREFDSMVEIRSGGIDPDGFIYRMLHSAGPVNNFLYKDSDLDRLLDRGRVIVDYDRRKTIYDEVQRLIMERAPVIPLYSPHDTWAMRGNVRGYRQVSTAQYYYLEETWVDR
jgi:peptide/nickel transport system substrate-binding protein